MISHIPSGYHVISLEETESTNDIAKNLAKDGETDHAIIWAKSQTKGRGRYGKEWISPEGNAYFSLLLRPNVNTERISELPFLSAISLGSLFINYERTRVEYKWPNDVLINDKKVAGILIESLSRNNRVEWVVVGVGVNISKFPEDGVSFPATCLENEDIITYSPAMLIERFVESFDNNYKDWLKFGFDFVRETWLKQAFMKDKEIKIVLPNETIIGTFIDIDQGGALVVRHQGAEHVLRTGQVFPAYES